MLKDVSQDNKKPLSVSRKGLVIQVRLELIDGLCCEHEGVLTKTTGFFIGVVECVVAIAVAMIHMIPTEFQAGQHIRPEGILNRGGEFLSLLITTVCNTKTWTCLVSTSRIKRLAPL